MAKSAKPVAKKPSAKKPAAKKPAAKKVAPVKKVAAAKKAPKTAAPAAAPVPAAAASSSGVHITSSKVCNAFKTRAEGLAAEVKKAKPGVSVTVDHQPALGRNPDKGSFIVVANGKTLVSCVAMPRPFTTMKALDMAAVAKQVIESL